MMKHTANMMKRTVMKGAALMLCSLAPLPASAESVPVEDPEYESFQNELFQKLYISSYENLSAVLSSEWVEHGVTPGNVCHAIDYGQKMGLFWKVRRCETKVSSIIYGQGPANPDPYNHVDELSLQVMYTHVLTENLDGELTHFLVAQLTPETEVHTRPDIVLGGRYGYDIVRNGNLFAQAYVRMCLLEDAKTACGLADDDTVYGLSAEHEVTTDMVGLSDAYDVSDPFDYDTNRRTTHTYRMTGDGRLLSVKHFLGDDINASLTSSTPDYDQTGGLYNNGLFDNVYGLSKTLGYRPVITNFGTEREKWRRVNDGLGWAALRGGYPFAMTTQWKVSADMIGSRNLRMGVTAKARTEMRFLDSDPDYSGDSEFNVHPGDYWKARSSASFDIEPDY